MLKFGVKIYIKFDHLLQARNNEQLNKVVSTSVAYLMWSGAKFQLPIVNSYLNSGLSKVIACRDAAFFQSNSKVSKACQKTDLSV